jgi:alkyl hydroperoxide reductase subunit AhpC
MATLRLGDTAPTQDSTAGKISFHQWAIYTLFSHPAGTSHPVLPTESGKTAKCLRALNFKQQRRLIALSVDPLDKHGLWIAISTRRSTPSIPIIDVDKTVANLYDMIQSNASATATVRAAFYHRSKESYPHHLHLPASSGPQFR